MKGMMADFMYHLKRIIGYPDSWLNIIAGLSMKKLEFVLVDHVEQLERGDSTGQEAEQEEKAERALSVCVSWDIYCLRVSSSN